MDEALIRTMPKAELHVHLEGTFRSSIPRLTSPAVSTFLEEDGKRRLLVELDASLGA